MQLTFEHVQKITDGHTPAAYHSPDNVLQVFYTDGEGRIWATSTDTPKGNFADREFTGDMLATQDTGAKHLSVAYLPRMNLWATWLAGDTYRMAVFLLKQETNKYLVDGDLSFQEDDPGVSLSLTLENPEGIISTETATETPPGTRIGVYFRTGDSSRIPLGIYYLDRIVTKVGDPQVQLSARNSVGKLLKDQSFDEDHVFPHSAVSTIITSILQKAGVVAYRVQQTGTALGINFPPNMSYYDGIMSLIGLESGWMMKEDSAGKVIIGNLAHVQQFIRPGTYQFSRGRDCFGREVTRDDRETYSRVCVHDKEFTVAVWRDVEFMETWNLPRRKTLYVEIPEGTPIAQANATAEYMAERLAAVGVVESFAAPFRPQLQPGDLTEIVVPGKLPKTLGTITQVGLKFGRGGFYTDFTVDSGGMLRKPRIRDLVELIGGRKQSVGSAKITS